TRNGPRAQKMLDITLGSEVLVWREGKGWQGPYQVQTVDQTNTIVTINNIPKTFRTTHCKPFHRDPAETQEPHDADERTPQDQPNPDPDAHDADERTPQDQPNPDPDAHDRPWTQADLDRALQKERLVVQLLQGEAYVTEKEKTAWDLAIALRAKGKINTPGPPFEAADDQEVDSLIAKGAIEIMKYDPTLHKGRMWKTRLVREIKGQTSAQPYEKSRMVLQG
ncbi:hypothetical protein ACKVV1_011515, partial [Pyricularia oryzae]